MILFLIKKWFFDFWDNFFAIAILNIGYILLLIAPISGVFAIAQTNLIVGFVLLGVILVVTTFYSGVVHYVCAKIVKYEKPEFRDFFEGLKATWKYSLVFSGLNLVLGVILVFIVPFYLAMGNLVALAALVFLFWVVLLWLLVAQYYFPIQSQLEQKMRKLIKKSFIIFFDNGAYSLFVGILGVLVLGISALTAFLVLGPASIALLKQAALKLRLYKYDYLEANPDANRKKIPWRALLTEEQDRVGKRSFRGMIFPWKE